MRSKEMRRQRNKAVILSLGCTLAFSSVVYGEEKNTALTEITADRESTMEEDSTKGETIVEEETSAKGESITEEATVTDVLELGELKIENRTGRKAGSLRIKKAGEEIWGENLLEQKEFIVEEEQVYDLCLTDETGKDLLFYNLLLGDTEELSLFEKGAHTYVTYWDTVNHQEVNMSQYALEAFEEPQTLYTKARLNVRSLPSTEGEVQKILSLGEGITALGTADDWYLIRSETGYGYVSGEYVTDSKEEADRLIEEAQAAEAAARAEEAARAAQAAAAQSSAGAKQSKTEKKKSEKKKTQKEKKDSETKTPETKAPQTEKQEVSRENVPSCDDPDHGSTYITYSDGSVDVVDY